MDYNITYRDKDGSIQAIVSYKDASGEWKQKAKQGFKKKGPAKTWANSVVDKLKEKVKKELTLNKDYEGVMFDKFKEMFLEHQKKYWEPNTIVTFNTALNYFKDLDKLCVDKITLMHIQKCIDKMIDNGLLLSSMKLYLSHLNTMFNNAVEPYEIILKNPVNMGKLKLSINSKTIMKKKEEKIKALSEAEFQNLLSKIDNPKYYIATLLAGNVGLRIGEIRGITRNNINPSGIKIDKQWKRDKKGNWGFGKLKSPNSYRTASISPKTYKKLKEYEKGFPSDIYNRLIIQSNGLNFALNLYYKKLGFDISVHDLRHTYVTRLIAKGLDFKTIADFIGDDVKQVIKTYSHVNKDMLQKGKEIIRENF